MISPKLLAALLMLVLAVTSGAAAQEQPVIHVAVSAFESQADAYYAQELGLFKRAGLNVDIQQLQGGAAIVAGIVSGAVQIGAGNPIPLANAHEHGFDIVLVAAGSTSDASLPPVGGLLVAANSPVRNAKDLEGKVVGVNALHSIDQIAVEAWLDQTGGDSRLVKFVEIPQATMIEAVVAGRIDAVMIADPGLTDGLNGGQVRLLGKANDAIAKQYLIVAWFASRAWANQNADAVRKFAVALNTASAWATKNPEAAATVLRKYLRVTKTRADERHANTLDPAMLQPLLDAAVRYKVIAQPLDAHDMIWH